MWLSLDKPDPYLILPILAAVFTFASTYLSSMSQLETNASLKIMNYVMPAMIFFMGISLASSLSLYWVVSNAFQTGQTLLLNNPFKIRKEREEAARQAKARERALEQEKREEKIKEVVQMPIYEGYTIEEATQKGLQALGLTKEDVTIDVLDEGKKGFLGLGKKLAQISMEPTISEQVTEAVEETVEDIVVADEATAVEEAVEELTEAIPSLSEESTHSLENLEDEAAITELAMYLTNISNELNAPAMVRIARENGNIIFHLETEKQGILIGKHGKVLNALQYLAQVFIHRIASNKLSIVVNVGNYREKRHEILERLAKRTAEKAKRTGRPVFLEPMPAFERKQIHHTLSKDEQIKTHSEGDEPYRYLVVEPVKKYF